MKLINLIFSACLFAPALAFAAVPSGFKFIKNKEITEDNVTFRYMSSDGTIDLPCTAVYDEPDLWDWDVYCGKGTKMLRQFRVHLLIRMYENRQNPRSAMEVLYWVIDRDKTPRAFSSTSSWIQYRNLSDLEVMRFSQGVENDYATLTVEFKP